MAAEGRKVYGDLNTPDTLKVLACLFEHDLDFEFVPINLEANQHRQEQFLSMSVSLHNTSYHFHKCVSDTLI